MGSGRSTKGDEGLVEINSSGRTTTDLAAFFPFKLKKTL